MVPKPHLLVVDDSDHRLAGGWFRACLEPRAACTVRWREDAALTDGSWDGVIFSGSERSVFEDHPWVNDQMAFIRDLAAANVPVLGVCYGHQLIFRALYGKDVLARRAVPEVGWYRVTLEDDGLFAGVGREIYPYIFHHDQLAVVPDGWGVIARSEGCDVHAVASLSKPIYGLQFHPEVTADAGSAGIKRMKALLEGHGLDVDAILRAETPGGRRGYAEIVRRFAGAANDAGAAAK